MSDEFILSLRHSLHHVYSVARTLSWLHFIPLVILALAIIPLTGCGDKHENTPPRAGGTLQCGGFSENAASTGKNR